jgi:hypothetical protein
MNKHSVEHYGFPDETADAVGQYIATLIVGMLKL